MLAGTNIPVFFGGALTVASHFGSLVVSAGVFISCLYYFLEVQTLAVCQLDANAYLFVWKQSKDSLVEQLGQLSPFDGQDNKKLIRSIKVGATSGMS